MRYNRAHAVQRYMMKAAADPLRDEMATALTQYTNNKATPGSKEALQKAYDTYAAASTAGMTDDEKWARALMLQRMNVALGNTSFGNSMNNLFTDPAAAYNNPMMWGGTGAALGGLLGGAMGGGTGAALGMLGGGALGYFAKDRGWFGLTPTNENVLKSKYDKAVEKIPAPAASPTPAEASLEPSAAEEHVKPPSEAETEPEEPASPGPLT